MSDINNEMLSAFKESNTNKVKQCISLGGDTGVIINEAQKMSGWNLTLIQGWILEDIYNKR